MLLNDLDVTGLTIENSGDWPQPVKIAVVCICCVLLLLSGYWFDTGNLLAQLHVSNAEKQQLLTQIEIRHQRAANLTAYKLQVLALQNALKTMRLKLPERTEVPGLLEEISKAAVASGLTVKLFKPLPERQRKFYAELPIEITVTGNYHQLGQFVSKVSSFNRMVSLHDYVIVPEPMPVAGTLLQKTGLYAGNEQLNMTITAKTYRYLEQKNR